MSQLPPIRRQVIVPGPVETAFAVFTDEIGHWWPLEDFSVHGKDATVAFHESRVVERGPGGEEAVWGTVLDWQPPHRLRITWHPGHEEAKATEVEVTFAAVTDDQTLVTLEHRGWERLADPAAARSEYDQGWPAVLGLYAARTAHGSSPVAAGEPVWLALMHTAGPALPAGTPVFGHPDFAEHIAFLRRLDERGVLVAAGPFGDGADGMTVIRVPDATEAASYVQLAQADDQSVVRGLLLVRVQPWHVSLVGTAT
jgi:uncharacterized protein YndB with AHSA1/START domain/uncharacterized protein YciI